MKEFFKDITVRKYWFLKLLFNKKQSFLYQTGWIRSFQEKKPVDLKGNPKPWLSLSFLYFLEKNIKPEHSIFEYGSGNSTLYFSNKGCSIISVEHDKKWYEFISKTIDKSNVTIHHFKLGEDYVFSINNFKKKFNIILVDGRLRNKCVSASIANLTENGIIILDDSNREKYTSSRKHLESKGFKEIEFWGSNLGGVLLKSTSIFYRKDNCFDI